MEIRRWRRWAFDRQHEELDEVLLQQVEVLTLIDQDVAPAALELMPNVGMVLEESDRDEQQIGEVERVPMFEGGLVRRNESGERLPRSVG